ncbi:MAG TPA: hypothetical protein VH396_15420 [Chitinophagaceae bacterium]|jgi:hypothetical protein
MNNKQQKQDRHLQAPGEANRDKHINFLAEERGEKDPADEGKDATPDNRNAKKNYRRKTKAWKQKQQDRHLQAPGEANRDKHINFLAEERGEEDLADEGRNGSKEDKSQDDEPNAVYTNSDAARQQIERTSNPQLKGRKDDPLSDVYATDDSTLQTKEEHEHDKNVHPNRNNKIDIPDLRETDIDKDVSSNQGQSAERNP